MANTAREFDDFSSNDLESDDSLSSQIDLQHYLRVLRKYKWPVAFFTALITALAGYYAYTATPIYRATSTLLIESQKANVISIEELVGLDAENSEYYATQHALLKSRQLAERVVDYLDLWQHPELTGITADSAEGNSKDTLTGVFNEFLNGVGLGSTEETEKPVEELDGKRTQAARKSGTFTMEIDSVSPSSVPDFRMMLNARDNFVPQTPEELQRQAIVGRFMSRLNLNPIRGTKLVEISYDSSSPELAMRVANAVGEQYITSYLDARMELTSRASTWLNERLMVLKVDLDKAEDRLIAFKQANGLVDVGGSVGRLNEQELLLATAELAQARSELSNAADLYREVRALRGRSDVLTSIVAIQSDPLVQQVKVELGQRQRELDELRNRYGLKHPQVIDALSRLSSLNETMTGHVNRVVDSIEKNYQFLQQRVSSIETKLSSGKQDIQALGTKRFELDALDRELTTKRSIYDTFYSRMTEASSADGLEAANARVSDYATMPYNPVKPKKQLIIALAALASLVLSTLMAILYENMDDTVKGTTDVEDKLGLRLLGILPLLKGGFLPKRGESRPLNPLDIEDKKGTFFEAVNTARTAICMDDGVERRKVIVITSSIPGEGKSTVSINLAYSLAKLERVLLMDCDMRRPTLAKAAGFDKNIDGLSNLITGTSSAKNCIKRGAFGGSVDLLSSGPATDQPLELLSSKRFEKLLQGLSRHYDRIVIDSAPSQAVSDALVLSSYSDAVVYIIKSHDTTMDLVKRGILRIKQAGGNVVGAIITQVDIEKITSYGGDHYYQGYYDYYGYRNDDIPGSNGGSKNKIRLTQEEIQNIQSDDRDVDLDLDYGVSGVQRANGSYDEEFDFTARIDNPGMVAGGDKSANLRATAKAKDDLDIL